MEKYNDEIQLKDILIKCSEYKVFLLKKKFIIIGLSSLFFVIGVVLAFNSETKYNAELTFVVEEDSGGSGLGAMSGIASQFGFDIGGNSNTTFSQSNILELLKSRGVIEGTNSHAQSSPKGRPFLAARRRGKQVFPHVRAYSRAMPRYHSARHAN